MIATRLPKIVKLIFPVINKLSAGSIWHANAAEKMLEDLLPVIMIMQNIVITYIYFAFPIWPILRSVIVTITKAFIIKTSVM